LDLLDEVNNTEHDLEYDDILDAFNSHLSNHPDNTLVSYKNKSYSYGEGAFIADKIAKSLIKNGVKSNDHIAFLVPRSELYLLNVLSILSLGGVYVPLDDTLPDERLKFLLKDSNCKVIIVSDETNNRANDLNEDSIILNISNILKDEIKSLEKLPAKYNKLACVLYTSGTTGVPKGVKVRRKGINNFVDYYVNKHNMDNDSTFGLFSSIGFDVGAIRGICAPIYTGACLDIIPIDIRLNIDKLNKHFIDKGVTHTSIPTQVARMFIDEVESTSLKVLITGGEKLGDIDYTTDYTFIDSYGPTECCVSVCDIEVKDKKDSSSIGHLFTNTKGYILDNENRRVPIGAVGELCIAGNQTADGYLNRPKETAASFVKNPFNNNEEYSVMYRTGDLVRVLEDGTFAIVGRRDDQVKIRGNRVELSEVEKIIREIDYIEEVTVQIINNDGNNELVAFIVSKNEYDHADEIQRHVGENKPDYMVPSFVVKLDKIPLTVNGKVDKQALPEVDRSTLHAEYVAPRNKKERDIVNAFEKIFNQTIGIYDDFTQLGGDSLTAIKLLTSLKDYNISAGDILSLRTPYAIANSISDVSLDLDEYSLDSGCPLNEPQLNVYLDILANDKKDSYLIPSITDIPSKYNINELKSALDMMLEIHPILGMCVSDNYDVPYLIKGSKPPAIVESDVSDEFITEFLTKPFNLHDHLCKFLIINKKDKLTLYSVFHHIIFDAISDG
ncbi:MAG: amino acid adenylation domain-containing protein, partial [Methanobrevibacter sp.]